jgi:prolyl 4-hydroxylase
MINVYNNEKLAFSVMHNFISIEECEEMLAYSWQNLKLSDVISNDGKGQKHEGRTGSNTWLKHDASPLIGNVAKRISQMVRMSLENAEPFQIVHYGEGQKYDYHHDSFDESDETYNEDYVKTGGQRIVTVLGYLRDVPQGGETGFCYHGLSVQPKAGTVVSWYNVNKETNERDERSQHAGLPVIIGEKYAFNLWFREGKFKYDK